MARDGMILCWCSLRPECSSTPCLQAALRSLDLSLPCVWQLNLGLHELASPHGKRRSPANHTLDYAARMLRLEPPSGTRVAWIPMTVECSALLLEKLVGRYSLATAEARTRQAQLVDAVANASLAYLARWLGWRTSPLWWNANAPLPRQSICELSADGVHLHQWVTLVLARLLLTDLCRRWAAQPQGSPSWL